MSDAYIVAAVRTPIGRRGGGLASCHPADLLATVLCEVVARAGVEPDAIDDVIVGCVSQTGAQSFNIARTALLSAGFPEAVPGTTVDRQCGSSQQAVHFAAQGVMAGSYDLVVAAGVEVMSLVPIFSSWQDGASAGHGEPLAGERWRERYGDTEISQFNGAELLAERYAIDRDAMEDFAERSHSLAREATDGGRFADEINPIGGLSVDEGFRRDVDRAKMRSLAPIRHDGRITPATSSQVSDGAAAVLIASSSAVARFGLRPLARVAGMTVAGSDPVVMLDAPIPATRRALSRAGLRLGDIDLVEVNEAFASVPLAWARALEAPLERVNVNGGAIALGHPIGASGARLMTTLVHEMRRRGARYGLQTMCEAGGLANATILELHDGAAA
jgi:acetyl-CoA C-acetyltransferase